MELKVLEQSKTKMIFELKGEDHTFCNVLKDKLWEESEVTLVSYKIDHPLIGVPQFIIETKGKEPVKVLESAAKKLQKDLEQFKKAF